MIHLLCDQNVAAKYVQAFDGLDEFVVTTVADELSPDASDEAIVEFAETHDWVVFTSDDDFFEHADQCGVLVYNQLMDPSPGDVLTQPRQFGVQADRVSARDVGCIQGSGIVDFTSLQMHQPVSRDAD